MGTIPTTGEGGTPPDATRTSPGRWFFPKVSSTGSTSSRSSHVTVTSTQPGTGVAQSGGS